MGLFDWIFGRNVRNRKESADSPVNLTFRVETVKTQEVRDSFSGMIAGVPIRAEVPTEAKAKCDKLLRKQNRTSYDNEYLNDNYWVNVYYKGQRHGYHGVSDIWTYSARDLPELPSLHDWVYSILGKKKAEVSGTITTIRTWEEKGAIHVLGAYNSLSVEVSFRPRGLVLSFVLKDDLRWEDKASYNTKTGHSEFPFYYSATQPNIIEWAAGVFEQKRLREKGKYRRD